MPSHPRQATDYAKGKTRVRLPLGARIACPDEESALTTPTAGISAACYAAGALRTWRVTMPGRPALDELRGEIALGCRVLAGRGLADGILGHISLRIDTDHLLVRCRGPRERGLAFTEPDDIQLLSIGGDGADAGYSPPNELPLHTAVLRAQP